jgi:hypothetical protein
MSAQAFIEALPPATDYMTYLTIVEYNLTEATLPALHQVLQNEELTRNIGWDLINLVLPMLPKSEEVLDVIVRLGNPREVVLKVTEALRLIQFDEYDVDSESEDEVRDQEAAGEELALLPVLQAQVLLRILPPLHARLKTKFPSRFLSTTLQAVLATFSGAGGHCDAIYPDLLLFVGAMVMSPSKEEVGPEEAEVQTRLLQSFLTHAFEIFAISVPGIDDDTCLAWSGRLFESLMPERVVPGRPTITGTLSRAHKRRKQAEDDTLAIATRLMLDPRILVETITTQPATITARFDGNEEDPPDAADDIPLSRLGSTYLLTSMCINLIGANKELDVTGMDIFPLQAQLIAEHIGSPRRGGLNSIGSEPITTIDAILALALLAVTRNMTGTPSTNEVFNSYLQCTSLLSANTPQPSLRYLAHFMTSTVLHSHPSDDVKLRFIHDTLEHCPYENLKASAVEWFKNETMAACQADKSNSTSSSFSSPTALASIATVLFPAQHDLAVDTDMTETWVSFAANLSFHLASLNLYYFLLTATEVRDRLQIEAFHKDYQMRHISLTSVAELVERLRESLTSGDVASNMEDGDVANARLDLSLVADALGRIDAKLTSLGLK